MRIRMYPPHVEPDEFDLPLACPYDDYEGKHFKLHQRHCQRSVLDPNHERANVRRHRCLTRKRTFGVYPRGVSNAQRSARLRGIGDYTVCVGTKLWRGGRYPVSITSFTNCETLVVNTP